MTSNPLTHPTTDDQIGKLDAEANKHKVSKETIYARNQRRAKDARVRRGITSLIKREAVKTLKKVSELSSDLGRLATKVKRFKREDDLEQNAIKRTLSLEFSKISSEFSSFKRKLRQAKIEDDSRDRRTKKNLDYIEKNSSSLGTLLRRHQRNYNRINRCIRQYQLNGVKLNKIYTTVGGSATENITISQLKATQTCIVTLHTKGATPAVIVESRCEEGKLVVIFDVDPSTDHKINYHIT